jgi:queuosine precursor transporter
MDFLPFVKLLQSLPPEAMSVLLLIALFSSAILLMRFFGVGGGYAFMGIAAIAGNILVLKQSQYGVFKDPLALGTELFAASYLCTDIMTELYGKKAARRAVFIGFASFLLFTVIMLLGLGFAPLTVAQAGESNAWNLPYQGHLEALFLPMPAFFIASICAYLTSQLLDIYIYDKLRTRTGGRQMWLRNNAATVTASLIDNTIFSVLAFVVFQAAPVDTHALIYTYILGTFALRIAMAVFDTPFLYLAVRVIKRERPDDSNQ